MAAVAERQCAHSWVLPEAKGEMVEGFCAKCGQTEEFSNVFQTRREVPKRSKGRPPKTNIKDVED